MPPKNAQLSKLVELGFSKTQSAKALKDCNNNFQQAKSLLENAKRETERKAQSAQPSGQAVIKHPKPQVRTTEAQKTKNVRNHPCIVQFGACRYGTHCMFRYLPGDTCINYILGNCIYGSSCQKKHTVDGVDFREQMKGEDDGCEYVRHEGKLLALRPADGGHGLMDAEIVEEDYDEDYEAYAFDAPPEDAVFDVQGGSAPTHSDPIGSAMADDTSPQPTPFLQKLVSHAQSSEEHCVTVRPAPSKVSSTSAKGPTHKKHPCIVQCGTCHFGSKCRHADVRGDVCVHWLNGKCVYSSDKCKYHHAMMPLKVELLEPEPSIDSKIGSLGRQPRPPVECSYHGTSPTTTPSRGEQPVPTNTEATEAILLANLQEAFPTATREVLLYCWRASEGDVDLVAELVQSCTSEKVETRIRDVEKSEGLDENHSRNVTLLTLCSLFPDKEPVNLAQCLEANDGEFGSAYIKLLAEEEKIPSKSLGQWDRRGSTGESFVVEKMLLDRLQGMFPSAPDFLIRECLVQAKGKARDAIALISEVQACDASEQREKMGKDATTGFFDRDAAPQVLAKESDSVGSFVVTSSDGAKTEAPVATPVSTPISATQLFRDTIAEADGIDWRRVRREAYCCNTARAQSVSLAVAAFQRKDHATGRRLLARGHELGRKYERLNMLAMHALEREGARKDPSDVLDLHGFHQNEAVDVLHRRVNARACRGGGQLKVVVGAGRHSASGHSPVALAVGTELDALEAAGVLRICSVKQAMFVTMVSPQRK